MRLRRLLRRRSRPLELEREALRSEEQQLDRMLPGHWQDVGPFLGLRGLTRRRTTTEWRGD